MEQLGLYSAIVLVAIAVVVELATDRIPNWLSLTGILAGVGMGALDEQWSQHLVGLVATTCLILPCYAVGGLGAGAAKMIIAIGALAGPLVGLVTCLSLPLILAGVWVWSRINQDERCCPSSPFVATALTLLLIVDGTGLLDLL